MMVGMKGKEDRECTGGLDWKGVGCWCWWWWGGVASATAAYPPFSVDVSALCGPPHTDTPANESDLVSTSQEELRLYVSVLARTKHTSINILAFFLSQC